MASYQILVVLLCLSLGARATHYRPAGYRNVNPYKAASVGYGGYGGYKGSYSPPPSYKPYKEPVYYPPPTTTKAPTTTTKAPTTTTTTTTTTTPYYKPVYPEPTPYKAPESYDQYAAPSYVRPYYGYRRGYGGYGYGGYRGKASGGY